MQTSKRALPRMDDYVFAGLVTISVTLFAFGVMDILAVVITTLSNMLWRMRRAA